MIPGLTAIGVFLVGVILALAFHWRTPKGEDSGLSVMWEDRTDDDGLEALYRLPAADRNGPQ